MYVYLFILLQKQLNTEEEEDHVMGAGFDRVHPSVSGSCFLFYVGKHRLKKVRWVY